MKRVPLNRTICLEWTCEFDAPDEAQENASATTPAEDAPRSEDCVPCGGTGWVGVDESIGCPACGGTGRSTTGGGT